jgi:hypothetical protein
MCAGKRTGDGGGGRTVIRNVEHANIAVVVSGLWRTWLLRASGSIAVAGAAVMAVVEIDE